MTRRFELALAAVWLAAVIAFCLLAQHAATQPVSDLDMRLSIKVNAHAGFLSPVLRVDDKLGNAAPYGALLCAVVAVLVLRRLWIEAGFAIGVLAPALLVAVLKRIVQETPPMTTPAMAKAHDHFSFPSGHVTGLTILFGLIFVFCPRILPWRPVTLLVQAGCIVIVATVGIARVWAFAHWPIDVAGAYLLATIILIPGVAAYFALRPKLEAFVERTDGASTPSRDA